MGTGASSVWGGRGIPVLVPFFTWVLLKVVPGTVIRKGLMGGEDERAGNSCKFLI